jgi:hypothetical protein
MKKPLDRMFDKIMAETKPARRQRRPRPDPKVAAILARHGLPPVPDALEARYTMRNSDWWVRTPRGWFWLDGREGGKREWKPSAYGPT